MQVLVFGMGITKSVSHALISSSFYRKFLICIPSACARAFTLCNRLPSGLIAFKTVVKEDVDSERENVLLLGYETELQARPLGLENILNELILFIPSESVVWRCSSRGGALENGRRVDSTS
jgi:hypothetical protein